MPSWYFPWSYIDWILRLELLIWFGAVLVAYWVTFRTLVMKRSWLMRKQRNE